MANIEPSMTRVLENVEESLRAEPPQASQMPRVTDFAPARQRGIPNATLQSIQSDIRRTITELEGHHARLLEYAAQLKRGIEEQLKHSG
jgi:hypothetical protein